MKSQKIKRTIIFVNIGIILLLIVTLWFSLYTIDRIKSNLVVQVHTRTVIIALKDNLSLVLQAETSERGFILTGDRHFLETFDSTFVNINSNIADLRSILHENYDQQNNLDLLQELVFAKISSARKLIDAKEHYNDDILQIVIEEKDRHLIDRISALNNRMQQMQFLLYTERQNNTNSSIQRAYIVFVIEGLFSILITIFLAFMIVEELNRRSRIEIKLNQSNTDLKIKNKEIEQFAYIASHDLQEPLRSISNFTRLLSVKLKDYPDNDVKEYMGYVSGASTRMSNLIYDLLEYSRIGKDTIKYSINCNKLIDDIMLDMSAAITESGAEINVQKLPVVFAFPYIKSLFQNLISNSLKFKHKNRHSIIDIFATENENEYIFTVKDNGIGIENLYHDKIFIIFQRLHARDKFAGTGIGLAQCKKIVELHGGSINVESEPDKGSSFIFTLPKN